jgi:hypothetical protein
MHTIVRVQVINVSLHILIVLSLNQISISLAIVLYIYSATVLYGHEEAETWPRLASPAVRRKQDRVQTKF